MTHRALIITLVIVNVVALAGIADAKTTPPTSDIVRTRVFEGVVRSRMHVENDGTVMLRMMSQQGEIRVKLGASNDGSGFVLLDEKTELGVHAVADKARTQLTVTDAGREVRLH